MWHDPIPCSGELICFMPRDTHSPAGRNQFVFSTKVKVDDYLEETSKNNQLEFTSIYMGPFFDWSTKGVQMVGLEQR